MIVNYKNTKTTNQKKEIVVSVIIPVLNEEKYIEQCIESILKQDYPKEKMEVIFIDGNSRDKTVQIIKHFAKEYPFIRVLNNQKKTVQYALNIGIRNSLGKYIVRLDAHAEYANDYISKCLDYLVKTGADNVGGPMVAKGKNRIQKIIAAAYHSPFALGGGKFHDENYEGYVDTVWLGAYKKDKIINIGLYDERFPRSEDDELNYRIIKSGGRIYLTPKIRSIYYPRDSFKELFKQYYEYGVWKVAVIRKHKRPARISHCIPMCFVLFLLISMIGFWFSRIIFYTSGAIMLIYLLFVFYYSFSNKRIKGFNNKLYLCLVHFILHVSYGLGFIRGVFKFI